MSHILLEDLTPLELDELRFCVESLGRYSEEEIAYIYNNLHRDEDGVVNYYIIDGKNYTFAQLYTN